MVDNDLHGIERKDVRGKILRAGPTDVTFTTGVRKFLTQREVACRFRVSPSTIKNWRERGLLHFFQAPGSTRVLYPIDAIDEFERRCTKTAKEVMREKNVTRGRSNVSTRPQKVWRI